MDFLEEVIGQLGDLLSSLLESVGGSLDFQEALGSLEGTVPTELVQGLQEFWPLLLVLLLIVAVVKLFELPLKLIWNGLIGAATLFVVNLVGSLVGFTMKITLWKALVAGFLGIPGTLAVIIYEIFG